MFITTEEIAEALVNIFSRKELQVITRVMQAFTATGSLLLVLSLFYMSSLAVNFSPQTAGIAFACNLILVFFFARFCRVTSLAVSLSKETASE